MARRLLLYGIVNIDPNHWPRCSLVVILCLLMTFLCHNTFCFIDLMIVPGGTEPLVFVVFDKTGVF